MTSIREFSDYHFDGKSVVFVRSKYQLVPRKHWKNYDMFYMKHDSGSYRFVSKRELDELVVPSESKVRSLERTKTRGRMVTHTETGTVYSSIKAAAEAHGISVGRVKSSGIFVVA
jgi:hypothetical protein